MRVRVGVGKSESIRKKEAKNEQNTAGSASREARRQSLSFLLLCCLSFPSPPILEKNGQGGLDLQFF